MPLGPGMTCSSARTFLGGIAWSPSGILTASTARGRAEPLILIFQVSLSQPPEEELERLTKKLVHDMSHPPSGEYFGELSLRVGGKGGGLERQRDSRPGFLTCAG